jgi:hypothetical protein
MLTTVPRQGDLVLFANTAEWEPKREPEILEVEYVGDVFLWVRGNKFTSKGHHYSESPRYELFDNQEAYERSLRRFYHFTGIKKAVVEYGVLRELSDEVLEQIFGLIKGETNAHP